MLFLCATTKKCFSRVFTKNQRLLLRIGATKSIGDYILLPEIRRFLAKPDQQLHFLVDNTAHLLAKLEDGELDFVVLEGLLTSSAMTFSCSARNRISASAPPAIPSPENRFPSRISSPNA
ncbi:MAG: LysR substrate-binding domain-containing protein [Fusicatenibacter saccharivorans]